MLPKEKRQKLPKGPGVYLMKDKKGEVIYIGKAKNLKNRINSYFRPHQDSIKTKALVDEIDDFDIFLTKTGVEALILERNLIRIHKPRYNIIFRDDKEYPFIRVDFKAKWPRIEKVRRRKNDGVLYLGPYANGGLLNSTLKAMFKVFPIVRCSEHTFKVTKRVCNYYHMKMCLGQCQHDINRDHYIFIVKSAIAFLQGKNRLLKKELTRKMQEFSEDMQYENAAMLRDQIYALDEITKRQIAVTHNIDEADVVNFARNEEIAVFNMLLIRDNSITSLDNFTIKSFIDSDSDLLISFLLQIYENRPIPTKLILPFIPENIEDLKSALDLASDFKVCTRLKDKANEYNQLLDLALKNASHHLVLGNKSHPGAKVELEILKETLDLNKIPTRMECIDISNFGSSAMVASDVCFIDGQPAKQYYRQYNIKSATDTPNDFLSIKEVVSRRIERGIKEEDLPDLLIIDGGKGQLSSALAALKEHHSIALDIVAIAKSREEKPATSPTIKARSYTPERVFIPGKSAPIILKEDTAAYRLMVKIRNEAHRFAIRLHRQKRNKEFLKGSILDNVPGIGKVLKKRLIETFTDLDSLEKASFEQIMTTKGMREDVAAALYSKLHEKDS